MDAGGMQSLRVVADQRGTGSRRPDPIVLGRGRRRPSVGPRTTPGIHWSGPRAIDPPRRRRPSRSRSPGARIGRETTTRSRGPGAARPMSPPPAGGVETRRRRSGNPRRDPGNSCSGVLASMRKSRRPSFTAVVQRSLGSPPRLTRREHIGDHAARAVLLAALEDLGGFTIQEDIHPVGRPDLARKVDQGDGDLGAEIAPIDKSGESSAGPARFIPGDVVRSGLKVPGQRDLEMRSRDPDPPGCRAQSKEGGKSTSPSSGTWVGREGFTVGISSPRDATACRRSRPGTQPRPTRARSASASSIGDVTREVEGGDNRQVHDLLTEVRQAIHGPAGVDPVVVVGDRQGVRRIRVTDRGLGPAGPGRGGRCRWSASAAR